MRLSPFSSRYIWLPILELVSLFVGCDLRALLSCAFFFSAAFSFLFRGASCSSSSLSFVFWRLASLCIRGPGASHAGVFARFLFGSSGSWPCVELFFFRFSWPLVLLFVIFYLYFCFFLYPCYSSSERHSPEPVLAAFRG